MSKICVVQVDFNKGYIKYNHPDPDVYNDDQISYNKNNIFMPSVRRWAEKQGYDYLVVDKHSKRLSEAYARIVDSPYEIRKDNTTRHFISDIDLYCFTRFDILMQDQYDFILYCDNDILVKEDCEPFPFFLGIGICHDQPLKNNWGELQRTEEKCKGSEWLSAGVFSVDRATGKDLSQWVLERLDKKYFPRPGLKYPGKFDQYLLNLYCNTHVHKTNLLDIKWNNIVQSKIDYSTNFLHFAGLNKTRKL